MRTLAVAAFFAMLSGAFVDAWVGLRPAPPPVHPANLQAALQKLQSERRPADVVVHSPLFEPALLGFLDEEVSPAPARRGRQWVLDDARQPMFVPGQERARTRFGDVLLRLVESSAVEGGPGFDLRRDLRADTLRLEDARGEVVTRCRVPRSQGGFACPGQPEWVYAAPTEVTIRGAPKDCVWAHPRQGLTLVFELPAPTEPSQLRLGAGLSDGATTMAGGAPVELELRQGERLGRLRVPNRRGWREKTLPIEPGAPVEIRIQTKHDGMRHLCIDARTQPRMEAGGS